MSSGTSNPLQQQSLPTGPEPSKVRHPWIVQAAKWAGIILLVYLIGPFTLIHAVVAQEDAAGPMWQAGQRWSRVSGSVLPSLLLYVPIILFHAPLAAFWASIFLQLAAWLHFPVLAWFGGTTIFPPVPSSTLLRWVLSFPLAGLLALCIEAIKPRTTWTTKRVITQDEQVELAAAQERKKLKAEQTSSTASTGTAPKAAKKSRAKATLKEEKSPMTPGPDSLWGSVDWSAVDDAHPAKQAALQAAAEQRDAQKRETERARFLAQQRSALQQEQARALAQQAKPAKSTQPSKVIDSTLASPVQPPAPTQPVEEYNWDEGEGSIQE